MKKSNRREFLRKAALSGSTATAGFAMSGHPEFKLHAQESSPANNIVYRDLGSTGFKVSEIGMGCMNMRDPELVRAAIDNGINYIDTAYVYMNGENERTVGQIMKTERDKVFLTTKVGLRGSLKEVPNQIETSLERLQTDHVDLLLLHHGGDTPEMVIDENRMKVLDDAKRKGQTRFVGFSTHTSNSQVYENAIKTKFYDAVLLCYNCESPPSLTKDIEQMRKAGIAVIAMKNLLRFETRPRKPLDDIREDKNGPVTYNQALIKWVLSNRYVDVTIPGITAFEHLAENMAIMGTKMGYNDYQKLYQLGAKIKGSHCMGLSGCTGCDRQCPNGVRVSEINRCLGYVHGYGDMRLARENYSQLPHSTRVDVCGDCEECTVKCVNGLNLTENIRQAKALFA
ncbi:aldo/keto reductase [Candidatus Latescibacterota bacterium]